MAEECAAEVAVRGVGVAVSVCMRLRAQLGVELDLFWREVLHPWGLFGVVGVVGMTRRVHRPPKGRYSSRLHGINGHLLIVPMAQD